ncbi:glycosyltransferase family 4 protein [Paenarthrobacter ureafaciens]
MKLLIDGYWLAGGPPSGKTVVRELIKAWSTEYPADEILLLVPHSERATIEKLDLVRSHDIKLLGTRIPLHGIAVAAMRIPGGVDAVITQNFTPIFPHKATKATFLHDAIFKQYPKWFTAKERIYLWLASLTLPLSGLILTSTKNEAERIRKYFQRIAGKVRAVGLGLPSWVSSEGSHHQIDFVRHPRPYILAVGRLNIRKNLQALINAFLSSAETSSKFDLVIVGEPDGKTNLLDKDKSSVHFLAAIDDLALRDLYQNASAFVFPSLDEGFGLPILEAAYFDLPIAASDISVFREIDVADYYFDPYDTSSIASALKAMTESISVGSSEAENRDKRRNIAMDTYNWTSAVRAIRSGLEKMK